MGLDGEDQVSPGRPSVLRLPDGGVVMGDLSELFEGPAPGEAVGSSAAGARAGSLAVRQGEALEDAHAKASGKELQQVEREFGAIRG